MLVTIIVMAVVIGFVVFVVNKIVKFARQAMGTGENKNENLDR